MRTVCYTFWYISYRVIVLYEMLHLSFVNGTKTEKAVMKFALFPSIFRLFSLVVVTAILVSIGLGQSPVQPKFKSQEISEVDGYPVLMKHLPEFDVVKDRAKFAVNVEELRSAVGERQILANLDMSVGAEATAADYPAGRLLIIEYSSPQASVAADEQFRSLLSSEPNTAYRRIGNYNAFVFDTSDHFAANALLDQVLYEKEIQWLGDNPFRISAERAFIIQTSELFFSTVIWILMGIGSAVAIGLVVGFIFFRFRERERAAEVAFANLSGMTILELDEFSSHDRSERTLGN
jgi:hypothetical protein